MLAPITRTITVPCPADRAFAIFADMAAWWPLEKRSMSLYATKSPAKSLAVDARLGGRIVETAADGALHHWGTFTRFNPPDHLQFDFHMGLPASQTGQVDVTFAPLGPDKTRVELVHSNWEGYGEMAEMMLNGYGHSWAMLFDGSFAAACTPA